MQPNWWIKIRDSYLALVDDRCLVHHAMAFLQKHMRDFPSDIAIAIERVDQTGYYSDFEEFQAQMNLTRWVYTRLKADEKDQAILAVKEPVVIDASRIRC